MDLKRQEIEKVEKFILDEINHISTPLEFMVEQKLAEEGIENDIQKDRLIRASVLYNIFQILENYDELKPTLEQFFAEKASKKKFRQEEKEI